MLCGRMTTGRKFILATRANLIWLVQMVTNMYDIKQRRDFFSKCVKESVKFGEGGIIVWGVFSAV